MAYAAALLVGLALIWLGWAPEALNADWLLCGAVAVVAVVACAALMRSADQEGAPYLRVLAGAPMLLRDIAIMTGAAFGVARRAAAGDPTLAPALVRLGVRAHEDARLATARAIARAPGAIVLDVEEGSLLVHVLDEHEHHDAALRAIGPGA